MSLVRLYAATSPDLLEDWAMALTAISRPTTGDTSTEGRRSAPSTGQSFELCIARASDGPLLTGQDLRRPMQIRRIACAFLNKWGVPDCAANVALLTSELVTNAFQHGRGSVSFRMTHADSLVELSVGSDAPLPALVVQNPDETDQSGRGLMLVDAIAEAWGVHDGRVWCTLPSGPVRTM
ncbi:ATP-binding protein [[Kitasatospora] papulosa]|uniref:ATP-binding protein n=1 Tax=[Kitasatospora] papulosa TaxID=1464011 RepID=UPI00362E4423